MADLTADLALDRVLDPAERIDYEHVAASTQVFVGNILERTGTAVQPYDGTGTADFAGIALDSADNSSGAAGDQSTRVLKRGSIKLALAETVSALDEGATIYAPTDNPADLSKTDASSDLPIGKIANVLLAGGSGANLVEIAIEVDGLRSL